MTNVKTTEESRSSCGVKGQPRWRKQRKQAFCCNWDENANFEGA